MPCSLTPRGVGCIRLALSVPVAHERRERHEGARRYDARLLHGSVAVRRKSNAPAAFALP